MKRNSVFAQKSKIFCLKILDFRFYVIKFYVKLPKNWVEFHYSIKINNYNKKIWVVHLEVLFGIFE